MNGRVLVLFGASSAGKTSVARVLQATLPGIWLVAGVDLFWGMLREETLPRGHFRTNSPEMRRLTRGWHRAIVALADEGNNVIADELWMHQWWLDDWRELLAGKRWWSVLLDAGLDALNQREALRGDRPIGMAAYDRARQPKARTFDLILDTDELTVDACADAIKNLVIKRRD